MNYYTHHLGDYIKDTAHLNIVEEGIYRRLLDLYYLTETAIPDGLPWLTKRIRLSTENEVKELGWVLNEFFELCEGYWFHKRCTEEIKKYLEKSAINRENGKRGGRPTITQAKPRRNPDAKRNESENNPSQEPIANSQEKEREARSPTGSRLTLETLPEDWKTYCQQKRPELDPVGVFENFRDYWIGVAGAKGRKADWMATWRTWVRRETSSKPNGNGASWKRDDSSILTKAEELGIATKGLTRFDLIAKIESRLSA